MKIIFISMVSLLPVMTGANAQNVCDKLAERSCDNSGVYTCTMKTKEVADCNVREQAKAEAARQAELAADERVKAIEKINLANKKVKDMKPDTKTPYKGRSSSKLESKTNPKIEEPPGKQF